MSSTSWPPSRIPAAAIIRSPPTRPWTSSCASTCALPRRRAARTARPAPARPMCSASSPATRSTAIGPFGDFHVQQTAREMVYLGGGAGMAPLRSHLSYLLETQKTSAASAIGTAPARGRRLFYQDYFEAFGPPARQLQLPCRSVRTAARRSVAVVHRLYPRSAPRGVSRYPSRPNRHRILSLRPTSDGPGRHQDAQGTWCAAGADCL